MREEICHVTGKRFTITQEELEACRHFGLEPPNISPEERFRRLATFQPETHFHIRGCDRTSRQLLSVFPPETAFPVYDEEIWASSFDPTTFAESISSSRPFFEQLLPIWRYVPRPAVSTHAVLRSWGLHGVSNANDCFLAFGSENIRRSGYLVRTRNCEDCFDCYETEHSRGCYECIECSGCIDLRFGEWSTDCSRAWLLFNCHGCRDCVGCVNLIGKQYCFFNEQLTEEAYSARLAELALDARPMLEAARDRFEELLRLQPVPELLSDAPGTTTGNYLRECEHVTHSFECSNGRYLINCHNVHNASFCIDAVFSSDLRRAANVIACTASERVLCCVDCARSSDLAYCSHCRDSSHLIGCVGMTGRSYCIANKQLTRSEYESARRSIESFLNERGIWGELFPTQFSLHAYNRSAAQEYMPLGHVTADMLGFVWDAEVDSVRPSQLLGSVEDAARETSEVPVRTRELSSEEISSLVFICEITGKPYQITEEEFRYYERLGLPPPARCFQQRHRERLARLSPHTLGARRSSFTQREIVSAFPSRWRQPVVALDEFNP